MLKLSSRIGPPIKASLLRDLPVSFTAKAKSVNRLWGAEEPFERRERSFTAASLARAAHGA